MFGPDVHTWVEQGDKLVSDGIKAGGVGSLARVAIGAGQAGISKIGGAPVFFRTNVIYLMREV
jgi:hypothetical protein